MLIGTHSDGNRHCMKKIKIGTVGLAKCGGLGPAIFEDDVESTLLAAADISVAASDRAWRWGPRRLSSAQTAAKQARPLEAAKKRKKIRRAHLITCSFFSLSHPLLGQPAGTFNPQL
ncbi:unnamed protein product [Bursaphelenchus xylophilus]|uniref:(pine wood nematode) hypothetical protein n=1 Tax=Bursaphelenchus xylophilus TaxID=6326 RepID=A0A1I7S7C9_BURXY|nr:unnamed protein product [Bursaphelenchus xylophilus]CAG9084921.1 unnamed protein product [Bursaphelenchus xylophilus]